MHKKRGKLAAGVAVLVLLFLAVFILCRNTGWAEKWAREHSGIPDVVGSRTEGDECILTVVANGAHIEDKWKFAEEVIRMYEENTFYTTRFSRDREEIPVKVRMSVYLKKSDIGRKSAVFCIVYDAESGTITLPEN